MKNIEREYKKRFSNQKMQEDDFDANDLWEQIEGGLHTPPPSMPKPWWTSKLIAISVVLMSMVGLILIGSQFLKSGNELVSVSYTHLTLPTKA